MPLLEWNDAYSVKIPSIDAQHIGLVEMINQLDVALKENAPRDALGAIFTRLIEYTGVHFAWEEKLFAEHGYAETELHKKQHATLVAQALDLKKQFETDSSFVIGEEFMVFLTNWLVNHIQGSDMRYTKFLLSKGVK